MSRQIKGVLMAACGPLLWGISGTVAQALFQQGVSTTWLVSMRLLGAGILLAAYTFIKQGSRRFFAIWHDPRSYVVLVCLAIFGMLGNQFTYFEAIHTSNAATATVMQFLAPTMIMLVFAVRERSWPTRANGFSVVLATIGTVLIVTHGNFGRLAISQTSLIWGILTAVTGTIYTVLPVTLIKKYGALTTTSWCMLIGGIAFNFYQPVWRDIPQVTPTMVWEIVFVVILGTLFSYLIYLTSLHIVTPTTAGLLDAFEPLC